MGLAHGTCANKKNNVEAWHSRFNKFVSQPHLSFFNFVLALKEEHENCQLAINDRQNGAPLPRKNAEYQRLNNRIMRIQNEYQMRAQNPIDNYLLPLSRCMPNPVWQNP